MDYKSLTGMEISEARKALGYWWILEGQSIGVETAVYEFTRAGVGSIALFTIRNIVKDVKTKLILLM